MHFTETVAPAASQRRTTPSPEGEGFPLRPYSGTTPGAWAARATPTPRREPRGPARNPPAGEMGKWVSRGVPAGIWDLGPSGTQGVRETSSGPRGVTGGSPRGVDVKPLLRGGPGTPDPGYPGSETPVSRLARGTPFPGVWGPGPSRTLVPGIRDPKPPGIPGIPGSALRSSEGLPPPPGEGSGEVVLHQPLAAGPRGPGPGDQGPGGSRQGAAT